MIDLIVKAWLSILKIEPKFMTINIKNKVFDPRIININNKEVCHIFGNGISLMDTVDKVNNNDFVISMNAGALIPCKLDIWMTELHPKSDEQVAAIGGVNENIKLFHLLKKYVTEKNPKCIPLVKNLWFNNISFNAYDKNSEFFVLQDFLVRPRLTNQKIITRVVRMLIADDSKIFGQMKTSLLTAILIAKKLGFKKIILHGCDGKGSHFFHHEYFDSEKTPTEKILLQYFRKAIPKVESDTIYHPGRHALSLYETYRSCLEEVDVKVIFAGELVS